MSRAASGDVIIVRPTNDIYTILSAVALVMVILALIAVWTRGTELFGGLTSASPEPAQRSTR